MTIKQHFIICYFIFQSFGLSENNTIISMEGHDLFLCRLVSYQEDLTNPAPLGLLTLKPDILITRSKDCSQFSSPLLVYLNSTEIKEAEFEDIKLKFQTLEEYKGTHDLLRSMFGFQNTLLTGDGIKKFSDWGIIPYCTVNSILLKKNNIKTKNELFKKIKTTEFCIYFKMEEDKIESAHLTSNIELAIMGKGACYKIPDNFKTRCDELTVRNFTGKEIKNLTSHSFNLILDEIISSVQGNPSKTNSPVTPTDIDCDSDSKIFKKLNFRSAESTGTSEDISVGNDSSRVQSKDAILNSRTIFKDKLEGSSLCSNPFQEKSTGSSVGIDPFQGESKGISMGSNPPSSSPESGNPPSSPSEGRSPFSYLPEDSNSFSYSPEGSNPFTYWPEGSNPFSSSPKSELDANNNIISDIDNNTIASVQTGNSVHAHSTVAELSGDGKHSKKGAENLPGDIIEGVDTPAEPSEDKGKRVRHVSSPEKLGVSSRAPEMEELGGEKESSNSTLGNPENRTEGKSRLSGFQEGEVVSGAPVIEKHRGERLIVSPESENSNSEISRYRLAQVNSEEKVDGIISRTNSKEWRNEYANYSFELTEDETTNNNTSLEDSEENDTSTMQLKDGLKRRKPDIGLFENGSENNSTDLDALKNIKRGCTSDSQNTLSGGVGGPPKEKVIIKPNEESSETNFTKNKREFLFFVLFFVILFIISIGFIFYQNYLKIFLIKGRS